MTDTVTQPPPTPSTPSKRTAPASRRALSALGLLAVVASALVGGNVAGSREALWGSETPEARPPAASRVVEGPTDTTAAPQRRSLVRSQPWWQGLTVLEGVGPTTTAPFTVADDAVQWRVKWSCDTGRLLVTVPDRRRPIVDAACPGADTGYGVRKGPVSLQVTADGPWRLEVDQQVDVPLIEPPLPVMSAPGTTKILTGPLYRMDQVGTGTLDIYRLPDGGHALRLEDFFVTANIDLELRLSPLEAPQTTKEYMAAPSVWVAPLDVTAGSLNFIIPPDVDPTKYGSVVVWCPIIDSAYAAVTLRPA